MTGRTALEVVTEVIADQFWPDDNDERKLAIGPAAKVLDALSIPDDAPWPEDEPMEGRRLIRAMLTSGANGERGRIRVAVEKMETDGYFDEDAAPRHQVLAQLLSIIDGEADDER